MKKLLLVILALVSVGSTLCESKKTHLNQYVSVKINSKTKDLYLVKFVGQSKTGTYPKEKRSVVQYDGYRRNLYRQCYDKGCGDTNCPWIVRGKITCKSKHIPFVYNYEQLNDPILDAIEQWHGKHRLKT